MANDASKTMPPGGAATSSEDEAAAMAAMGLPVSFASPNFAQVNQAASSQAGPSLQQVPSQPRAMHASQQRGGFARGGMTTRGQGDPTRGRGRGRGRGGHQGGWQQDAGYGSVRPVHAQGEHAPSHQHRDAKRKRGHNEQQNYGESDSKLLPLDQIPPMIRPSFTEDPWAHLK